MAKAWGANALNQLTPRITGNPNSLEDWIAKLRKTSKKLNSVHTRLELLGTTMTGANSKTVTQFLKLNSAVERHLRVTKSRFAATIKALNAFRAEFQDLQFEEQSILREVDDAYNAYKRLTPGPKATLPGEWAGPTDAVERAAAHYDEVVRKARTKQDQVFERFDDAGKKAARAMKAAYDEDSLHDGKWETLVTSLKDNPEFLASMEKLGESMQKAGSYITIAGLVLVPVTGGASLAIAAAGGGVATTGSVLDISASASQAAIGQGTWKEVGGDAAELALGKSLGVVAERAGAGDAVNEVVYPLFSEVGSGVIGGQIDKLTEGGHPNKPTPPKVPSTAGLKTVPGAQPPASVTLWVNPITGLPFEYVPSVITITPHVIQGTPPGRASSTMTPVRQR